MIRNSFHLAILILMLHGLAPLAHSQEPPSGAPKLPGVRLVETRAPRAVPQDLEIAGIEIDWTHPLLHAEMQSAPETPPGLPPSWSRSEPNFLDALRIQLVEPLQFGEHWVMALPWQPSIEPGLPPLDGYAGALSEFSWLRVADSTLPWIPGGKAFSDLPEWQSPLGLRAAHVAVRWMGRPSDVGSMPPFEFRSLCLLSFTTPETARTRFFVVAYRQPGTYDLARMADWIAAEARPTDWIALHSMGRDAIVADSDWRLQNSAADRTIERLGTALVLRERLAGEIIDWTRFDGTKIVASSFERDFPASNLNNGLLIPQPFAPNVWISREESRHGEQNWVRVEFNIPRPVSEIRLILPSAAGMSTTFNPATVRLLGSSRGADFQLLGEFKPAREGELTWQPARETSLRMVRIELGAAQGLPIDHRGRLAGIQVFGPWDGRTGPLPRLR